MLVLIRKIGESVRIGEDVVVVVQDVKKELVSIGIIAPRSVPVSKLPSQRQKSSPALAQGDPQQADPAHAPKPIGE